MYDDVESDFWKSEFAKLLRTNMNRTGAERLTLSDCKKVFEHFDNCHAGLIESEVNVTEHYATWEAFICPSIKIRLYVQSQVKGSLLQRDSGDLVKIADARFPYNPFPEISELFKNKDTLLKELNKIKESDARYKRQQKIAGEFIKALLKKKFGESNIVWNLKSEQKDFTLIISKKGEEIKYPITIQNFKNEIESLDCKNTN